MKEAYSAVRVHLNTSRILEEKPVTPLLKKFGCCTWDAFYSTVEPAGVWHGVKEFSNGGVSPWFIIIDDGRQSMNLDGENPNEDAKNLVLGGEKFRQYKGGSMMGPNPLLFDPKKRASSIGLHKILRVK